MGIKNQPALQKFLLLTFLLAVIGGILSIYSINHHLEVKAFGSSDAMCNIGATFNCDDIARSEYSELLGLPLGAWGLAFFLSQLILIAMIFLNFGMIKRHVTALLSLIAVGNLVSLALALISLGILKTGCLVCIGVYVVNILALISYFAFIRKETFDIQKNLSALATPLITTSIILIGYSVSRPKAKPPKAASTETKDYIASALQAEVAEIPISRSRLGGAGLDYQKGAKNSKVTIVKFSDFQCPACKRMAFELDSVINMAKDSIEVVYKNYPLDQSCNKSMPGPLHKFSCDSAIMARCAGMYDKFWEYHNLAFAMQNDVKKGSHIAWALQVGLTQKQIQACTANKTLLEKVQDDIELGNRLQVRGTPTLFINGQKFIGRGIDQLRGEVSRILRK